MVHQAYIVNGASYIWKYILNMNFKNLCMFVLLLSNNVRFVWQILFFSSSPFLKYFLFTLRMIINRRTLKIILHYYVYWYHRESFVYDYILYINCINLCISMLFLFNNFIWFEWVFFFFHCYYKTFIWTKCFTD